jgi:lysine-specific histone demethylase 1
LYCVFFCIYIIHPQVEYREMDDRLANISDEDRSRTPEDKVEGSVKSDTSDKGKPACSSTTAAANGSAATTGTAASASDNPKEEEPHEESDVDDPSGTRGGNSLFNGI